MNKAPKRERKKDVYPKPGLKNISIYA